MTIFKKQCTVPVTLTFEGQTYEVNFFWGIDNDPISVVYEFQIYISTNSREIKYQNIGRTHRQTDRPGENNTSQPPPGAR